MDERPTSTGNYSEHFKRDGQCLVWGSKKKKTLHEMYLNHDIRQKHVDISKKKKKQKENHEK